jgi:hypothetical protein
MSLLGFGSKLFIIVMNSAWEINPNSRGIIFGLSLKKSSKFAEVGSIEFEMVSPTLQKNLLNKFAFSVLSVYTLPSEQSFWMLALVLPLPVSSLSVSHVFF